MMVVMAVVMMVMMAIVSDDDDDGDCDCDDGDDRSSSPSPSSPTSPSTSSPPLLPQISPSEETDIAVAFACDRGQATTKIKKKTTSIHWYVRRRDVLYIQCDVFRSGN